MPRGTSGATMDAILTSAAEDLAAREAASQNRILRALSQAGIPHFFPQPGSTTSRDATSKPVSRPAPIRPPEPKPEPRASEKPYWQSDNEAFPVAIREAVDGGLDPNTCWTEAEMVVPKPTGGCVIPMGTPECDAWFHWNTPLHAAMRNGDIETAMFLLQSGADVNIHNAFGRTPLHDAVYRAKKDDIVFLMKQDGTDIEAVTLHAESAWDTKSNKATAVGGLTPLNLALLKGDVGTMQILLENGADASCSVAGWSSLDMALLAEHRGAIKLLISHGAQFSTPPSSLLTLADCKLSAIELLAVAKSSRLAPPTHLHQVYHVLLSRATSEVGADTLETAGSLICHFFRELYSAAEFENRISSLDHCARCSELQSKLQFYFQEDSNGSRLEFRLADSQSELEISAEKGCPFCGLVSDALKYAEDTSKCFGGAKKSLFVSTSSEEPPIERERDPKAVDLEIWMSLQGYDQGFLRVHCGKSCKMVELHRFAEDAIPSSDATENIQLGTGSERAFWTGRKWLERCMTSSSHSICRLPIQESQLSSERPSLLLYVGGGRRSLRLVDGIDSMRYVALSYCDADSIHLLKTNTSNIAKHKSRISAEELPDTFQEAIQATRELGFEYLWIDALCRFHNDKEGHTSETVRSHAAFHGADLTIASLPAEQPSERLFQPRTVQSPHPVPLQVWRSKECRRLWKDEDGVVYCFAAMRNWLQGRDFEMDGPRHSRGWTLQDQLFSSRILYFGRGLLHWECSCAYLTEADVDRALGRYMPFVQMERKRTQPRRALRGDGENLYDVWRTEMEDYTGKTLPDPSHRFAGFWAYSKAMEKVLGNEYIGGIWKGDRFVESLCWNVETPAARNPSLPSWAWVSVGGKISSTYLNRGGRPPDVVPLTTLASHHVEIDPVSFRVSGSITLTGMLYPVSLLKRHLAQRRFHISYSLDCETPDEEALAENGYVVDILGFEHGPPYQGFGYPMYPNGLAEAKVIMVLMPVEGQEGTFRRVGLALLEVNQGVGTMQGRPMRPIWVSDEEKYEDVVTIV